MFRKIYPHSIELFDTVRRAPRLLKRDAQDRISVFIFGQLAAEGGFCNRAGVCDQYYTMFGLGSAAALNVPLPLNRIKHYLSHCLAEDLDLVHLVCLVKSRLIIKLLSWRAFYPLLRLAYISGLRSKIKVDAEKFRSADGGFGNDGNSGKSYAVFMGLNLYQDCGIKFPNVPGALAALENGQGMLLSTSATLLTKRQLTGKVDLSVLDWIAQQQGATGGFHASPDSPMPDLLSTAVALFTLRICGYPINEMADSARNFILDHWHENGGFTGTLVDDCADCEYTFYALMALGALAK